MQTRKHLRTIFPSTSLGWTAILFSLLWSGCAEREIPHTAEQRLPELEMIQTDPGAVEIQIAGSAGLRGFQGRLTYDAAQLRITGVETTADSARLDRPFHGSLETAQGALTVGLADTRQILLPARGSLLRFTFEPAGSAVIAQVTLADPLGADDQGTAVHLEPTNLEVRF